MLMEILVPIGNDRCYELRGGVKWCVLGLNGMGDKDQRDTSMGL